MVANVIAIIILDKLLSVRSIKNKEITRFSFTSIYFFSNIFFSLCISEFLTYTIFFFSEELLLTFFFCRDNLLVTNSLNFCLCGNVFICPSLLKDNYSGYRIPG